MAALTLVPTTTDPDFAFDADDVYWSGSHRTGYGALHATVQAADDGTTWSSLWMQHRIGKELCLSLSRDDWHALATLCEQAVRYMDKLEGETDARED